MDEDVDVDAEMAVAAPSIGLVQYALGRTLLPENLAEAITALSMVSRVSLRATAFFLEVILEGAKTSTGFGFGLTRRALIAAIGAARTMQALSGHGYEADDARGGRLDGGLFSILDKYTAVGISVIHHTTTMAELMAMSGISLVQDSIRSGMAVAEESVRVIDGIFGSNETSRALSSFIGLVRREMVMKDSHGRSKGNIRILAALTRSLTTFAVVQAATHRRTVMKHKSRVLYDCTVLGEAEVNSWRARLIGPTTFQPAQWQPVSMPGLPRMLSQRSIATQDANAMTRSHSMAGSDLCLTDFNDDVRSEGDDDGLLTGASVMHGLSELCGQELEDGQGQEGANNGDISAIQLRPDSSLPPQLRSKLRGFSDEQLDAGVVVDQEAGHDASGPDIQQVVYRRQNRDRSQTVWEIVTETTELSETVQRLQSLQSSPQSGYAKQRHRSYTQPAAPDWSLSPQRTHNPFAAFAANRSRSHRDVTMTDSGFQMHSVFEDGGTEDLTQDRQEWVEICNTVERQNLDDADHRLAVQTSPSPKPLTAALSRQRSIDAPIESKQRMSVVLKRVQRKLTRTTQIIMRDDKRKDRPSPSPEPSSIPFKKVRSPERAMEPTGQMSAPPARAPRTPLRRERSARETKSHQGGSTPFASPFPPLTPSQPRRSRRLSAASMRSYTSRQHAQFSMREGDDDPDRPPFPLGNLVDILHRFGRFATASYGHNMMSILGILGEVGTRSSTEKTHANVWAFANHVGVAVEDVLLSSFSDDAARSKDILSSRRLTPIVNFIVVDHKSKAIVLACRGTLGLSDVLVDLTCEYEQIHCESGQGQAHQGMWQSAQRLATQSWTVKTTLQRSLEQNPGYGLVTTGHSLGAGIAALVALQWSSPADVFLRQAEERGVEPPTIYTPFVTSFASGLPAGRPIHSYSYGPAAIVDPELSHAMRGLVTSVVHHHDFIPCFSLGLVRDLRSIAEVLEEAAGETASEILGRTIGLYQRRKQQRIDREAEGHGGYLAPIDSETEATLPTDVPISARSQVLDIKELTEGRTHNRAKDKGYVDPFYQSQADQAEHPDEDGAGDDGDLEDWLWSLIKTMRANAQNDKLYPPGRIYIIESFEVSVTAPEQQQSQYRAFAGRSNGHGLNNDNDGFAMEGEFATASKKTAAHRVILRACEDVVARFSEPIFSRSLFRDHSPTNYHFCLDLLKEANRGRSEASAGW